MSLEQALAANTAALQALTNVLAANPMQAPSAQPAPLAAPSFAAAVPPPIAPVVSTDTSPAPTTAFAQAAAIVPPPATTAAPLTTPPAAGGSVERDSKGMPYDGRIHSSSKAKVADGSWRYKRGTGDTYIKQVEDELRGAAAAPVVAAAAPVVAVPAAAAPVVGGVGTPWPFRDGDGQPVVPPAPVAAAPVAPVAPVAAVPPAPVAPPVVVAPPPAAVVAAPVAAAAGVSTDVPPAPVMTYESLMQALPTKIVSGELSAQQLQQACEQFGVPSIAALQARPDLVPHVAAVLGTK